MRKYFKIVFFFLSVFAFMFVFAVPADETPITIIQPNGKKLTFILRGDEHLHWFESLDGYTLLKNENGDLEFACTDENEILQLSGILACNEEERDEIELSFLKTIKPKLFYSEEQLQEYKILTGQVK